MTIIIILLVVELLNSLYPFIDTMLTNNFDLVFHADKLIITSILPNIKSTFYAVGISLIVMKFLKKGFEIYVLWTDGDPDADPAGYLVNFIKALITAVCFPFVYNFFVDMCSELTTKVMSDISASINNYEAFTNSLATLGLATGLAALLFFICYLVLYFTFLMRGIEMIILQIGLPIACTGLLDNDKGVFRAYINQFVKAFLTTMIQILLCKLGISIMLQTTFATPDNCFWGIAFMVVALTAPKMLREFLVSSGGGGGGMSNTIYQTTRVASLAKGLFK